MVPDDRSRYHDLTLFGICVIVDDDVTELYGVVESDNEEIKSDQDLESYLVEANPNVFPQSMARTKQTARKLTTKGNYHHSPAAVKHWLLLQIGDHPGS